MTTHRISPGQILTLCCQQKIELLPVGDYLSQGFDSSLKIIDCPYDTWCGGCKNIGSHKRDCPHKTIHLKTMWYPTGQTESVRNMKNIMKNIGHTQ